MNDGEQKILLRTEMGLRAMLDVCLKASVLLEMKQNILKLDNHLTQLIQRYQI